MKRLLQTLAIVAPMALSLSAADQVYNTKHDLSITGTNKLFQNGVAGNQTCVYCHTPHSAANTRGPLWNRAASSATYTTYGTTILGTVVPATITNGTFEKMFEPSTLNHARFHAWLCVVWPNSGSIRL